MKTKIIITGSRGLIGTATTEYFKSIDNCEVIEADISLGHDLTDENFVKEFFSKNQADYLINLFAINDHVEPNSDLSNIFTISLDSFRKFMEVNVTALFSVCREFAKNKDAKGIVNFSSTYGLVSPLVDIYGKKQKHIGYSASKGAVLQLTRHLATHLAPKIRVNCVVPGGIEHQQADDFKSEYSKHTPMGRMMRKNELAGILEYLCSEKSSYTTGSIITVDGGWTAW